MGRTVVFVMAMCPLPSDRAGTIELPSPTATTLFMASILSNSITGVGKFPANASHCVTLRRKADCGLPNMRGVLDMKAGVTVFGISLSFTGRMARSSSLKSGTISNAHGAKPKVQRVFLEQSQRSGGQSRFEIDLQRRMIGLELAQQRRQRIHQHGHARADANAPEPAVAEPAHRL